MEYSFFYIIFTTTLQGRQVVIPILQIYRGVRLLKWFANKFKPCPSLNSIILCYVPFIKTNHATMRGENRRGGCFLAPYWISWQKNFLSGASLLKWQARKGQSWRCEAQTYHSPGTNTIHAASFLLSLSVFIYQMGIMNLCLLGGFSEINLCECCSYNFT